ncbi:alkaline phosphatase family protein [Actinomadura xylanilytica]|uniref:alkaline phosphatase family protein n=1 Tax=Actinomadura xylanilytica TaxID=887459 RepID=UPI00255B363A|nr:alkaline phosphatase family protein [Actinomadura xylanilytica]MDL4775327.1 alkaline phosphatase family protein [Actinomadura xylanilytica]
MGIEELTRRGFLAGTAGAAIIAAGGPAAGAAATRTAPAAELPEPDESGIDHIVVVMMENRSFDHYLGWLPGADGRQEGLAFTDAQGVEHATHHLTVPHGCGFRDPDHSYAGGRVEYNDGKCDGWLRAGDNDVFSIGYFTGADLGFHGRAARDWTVCDRYFPAVMSSTFPNRIFQHAGQTDRVSNTFAISEIPTIWDRLKEAEVPARYYFSDVPFTALWGLRHVDVSRTIRDFYKDAARGDLPAVSFVEPGFLGEKFPGLSEDEHPLADIRFGQAFLNRVYSAVVSSPAWARTLLVINYDEWGGFFDHVPPPTGPDPRPDLGTGLRGFRVPCLLISPRARRGAVAHEVYDHTSVLKAIEWRWELEPLTVRDAAARNLAEALDFESEPDLTAPRYSVPRPSTGGCTETAHSHAGDDWAELHAYAQKHDFADRH